MQLKYIFSLNVAGGFRVTFLNSRFPIIVEALFSTLFNFNYLDVISVGDVLLYIIIIVFLS